MVSSLLFTGEGVHPLREGFQHPLPLFDHRLTFAQMSPLPESLPDPSKAAVLSSLSSCPAFFPSENVSLSDSHIENEIGNAKETWSIGSQALGSFSFASPPHVFFFIVTYILRFTFRFSDLKSPFFPHHLNLSIYILLTQNEISSIYHHGHVFSDIFPL